MLRAREDAPRVQVRAKLCGFSQQLESSSTQLPSELVGVRIGARSGLGLGFGTELGQGLGQVRVRVRVMLSWG